MLARFHRLRPRRLIVVGAILLGLSAGLAVVLDQMRRPTHEEYADYYIKYGLDDDLPSDPDRLMRRRQMFEEEAIGINGWVLEPSYHRAYTRLDIAGFLAGLALLSVGVAGAHRERSRRLHPSL